VTSTGQSDRAFLTEMQSLSVDLREVCRLLALVVLAMLLEKGFGGARWLGTKTIDRGFS